jgi:acetyl-CoA carboxylase biotin carboxyl carrier protein
VIGIIETMKLMNSISAGVAGEVADILVADGHLVEAGQVLMRVRRQDS